MSSAIAQPAADTPRAHPARSFRGLIWAFCLLLLAGIWWFVAQQTAFEHRQAVGDAVRQNVNRSIAFEQYVRRTLEAADLVTRYVAGRFARGDSGREFAGRPGRPAMITGNIASNGIFVGVSVVDARGDIVATSVRVPLTRTNVAGHPAFRAHVERDTGQLYVSRPLPSRFLGQNLIWLSRRLNHPDGSFAGVIAINILPTQFAAFYRDAQVNSDDIMAVIGLDGFARARRAGSTESSGEDMRGTAVMRRQMQSPNGTHLGPSVLDGKVRYFSHRRLADYGLFVTYGVLESGVLAPSRHRARIFIAGAALVSLVLIGFALLLTMVLNRRERRVEELGLAKRRLEEAQSIGQIGDWDYDLRTGAVFWSPQLLSMYERDARQGSPTFDEFKAYLDDGGRAIVDRAHAEAIRTGDSQEIEYLVRLPSGAQSHHQGVVIPTFDAGGNVVRLHGTDQNVSARKLLDLLQTHVAHLSRVEAMNAMAATLAHELNQPLTSASNYLVGSRRRLAGEGRAAAAQAVEGIVAAEQQVHLAADIIRRVREMVSNRPRTAEPVPLARIVDDAVALITMAGAAPALAVKKRIAADAKSVKGDRIQLQQVMINLLRNACDATRGHPAPEIIVSSRREGQGSVLVSVSDNGGGFAQPDRERFSPFATTKGSGLGLGLSISRTIIESHGGRIWTEDREGEGARVCFTLPAARRQPGLESAGAATVT
ncbi:MAG TPA: ATP-binding protein [Allosphingosinicella sp.]|nr:ATP-binding protein [Allosphingosinicella sp.]